MPVFLLSFVEGLLGPKFSKFARPLIYFVGILLLLGAIFAAVKLHDRRVIADNQAKTEHRASAATDQAANERANDTIAIAQSEQEAHNVVQAQPDRPITPTSHALACERLRRAGRNPPACR